MVVVKNFILQKWTCSEQIFWYAYLHGAISYSKSVSVFSLGQDGNDLIDILQVGGFINGNAQFILGNIIKIDPFRLSNLFDLRCITHCNFKGIKKDFVVLFQTQLGQGFIEHIASGNGSFWLCILCLPDRGTPRTYRP